MTSFSDYIAHGNPWLFFPVAVFLGILHGLEPGHSKTMMAAYIVAIRGTVWQAFLLGLSATVSHTVIIWILAFVGLHYSTTLDVEGLEPYFKLVTGVLVVGLAGWMLYRTYQMQRSEEHHHDPSGNSPEEVEDAHEHGHRLEMEKQLRDKPATNIQIILFGLTGGLLPCPSAFAVLLLCLQLKKVALGFGMVLAFSLGLAITLVTVGSIAAFSIRHASKRFKGFGALAHKLPYASSILMIIIGLLVAFEGLRQLVLT